MAMPLKAQLSFLSDVVSDDYILGRVHPRRNLQTILVRCSVRQLRSPQLSSPLDAGNAAFPVLWSPGMARPLPLLGSKLILSIYASCPVVARPLLLLNTAVPDIYQICTMPPIVHDPTRAARTFSFWHLINHCCLYSG